MESDIDIVYTWVNGADPKFQAQLQKCLQETSASPTQASASSQRFRDNEELRYSLRSLEAFAPWFRMVHVVTNGQVPQWLDTLHDRVSIVTHDMIFPNKSDLPTFNSTAIELHLHKIPNLSTKFLYFNDDCFLGRATSMNAFVTTAGGQYFYFQPIPLHSNMNEGLVHDRAYAYTQTLVEKLWSRRHPRLLPAHAPQLYDRDVIARLEKMTHDEFRETSSHKFRSGNDLVLRVLYSFFILEHPEQRNVHEAKLLKDSRDYSFVALGSHSWRMRHMFWKIQTLRPRFFCINDDLGDVPADYKTLHYLRTFLRSYFPHPSSFEMSI